ncbi:hypothetical protein KKC13_13355 [bacterium]|nr:hypothetical protein [bacterium]MBU1959337.1 hypothetical protein [bacterium]
MLSIAYKIKGLTFCEMWFASEMPLESVSILGLNGYRDSRMDVNNLFLLKEEKYTLVNDLRMEKEVIFSLFKSNVRNEIRKCKKIKGFTYHFDQSSKEQFLQFYTQFSNAKNLAPISKRSIDKYGENLFYISGYLDGILTNMQVYIVDQESGVVRLLHSISILYDVDDTSVRAKIGWINRYLHWQTMMHFKRLSFETFDWGGYNNGVDAGLAGIDKFKASFGGDKIKLFDYYTYPYFVIKKIQERRL